MAFQVATRLHADGLLQVDELTMAKQATIEPRTGTALAPACCGRALAVCALLS